MKRKRDSLRRKGGKPKLFMRSHRNGEKKSALLSDAGRGGRTGRARDNRGGKREKAENAAETA